MPDGKRWVSKYFKVRNLYFCILPHFYILVQGLGTGEDADTREYFNHMPRVLLRCCRCCREHLSEPVRTGTGWLDPGPKGQDPGYSEDLKGGRKEEERQQ
ncbi:hypothetical protein GALMADRAFT_238692 [Galerina marginata CBS 339.88]|uniref:Uncharacterized protein n=1 Tax=Galerina marginata (strain CBS 339.88) TaxID=685588 RepID=A0A067TVH7_GALM3|nr:hypothetical protein GALMADRAFT_238692 [Galerina marginata CBS 339.88]